MTYLLNRYSPGCAISYVLLLRNQCTSRDCVFISGKGRVGSSGNAGTPFQAYGPSYRMIQKSCGANLGLCFPRIPHRTEASGRVLVVSIGASSLRHSLAVIRFHLAYSVVSTSLLHVSLLLRMESGQYGQLVQEGKEVFSTVLVFLHT